MNGNTIFGVMLLFSHFKVTIKAVSLTAGRDPFLEDDRFVGECFRVMQDQLLLETMSQFLLPAIDDVH